MTPAEEDSDRAGSPGEGEPVFLVVGKLRRLHGLDGEIRMEVLTDFPERLRKGKTVYAGPQRMALVIRSRRMHQGDLLLSFQGLDDLEQLAGLRNQAVYVEAGDLPSLPEGEYYHHQVLGLRVVTESGRLLGILAEILETGSNDVYVIRPENGPDVLLPVLEEVILEVDLQRGEMRVRPLPGILPD